MSLKSDAVVDRIRARLAKIDPNNREVTHVYKCKVTVGGNVAKTWNLKNIKLYEGDDIADCTLICDDEAFVDLADMKIQPLEATEAGKLTIEGELAIVLKLLPYIGSV